MILVGQYDSPFVRRVAVTLHHYGMPFERNRLSVFQPAMAEINPLVRIPSLIIDGGETLIDSAAILDYLDQLAGPDAALTPASGDERRHVMQATVLATGAIEKCAAVVYERHFHAHACIAHEWVARCMAQLAGALTMLDGYAKEPWYFGTRMTQADVTIGCLDRLYALAARGGIPGQALSASSRHLAARCEALDAFVEVAA